MSETGNIETLAKLISNDIFKWFKWKNLPLRDTDWDCVNEHHNKKTHPSDVVFYYNDPYSGKCIYLNTDLKSYAKGSISPSSITKALTSLALSAECANVSPSWHDKFIIEDKNFGTVIGLLFIYNHDDKFDKDLSEIIDKLDFNKINIAEDVKVSVMDPLLIRRLLNTVSDMKKLVVDDILPKKDYTFFYPDLVRARRFGNEWEQPASLETLTSPWLIIKHKKTEENSDGYIIYYHSKGNTVEEFVYLIDAMSHYQMLLSNKVIRVRFTDACTDATLNFTKAKAEYLTMWGDDAFRKTQLDSIDAGHITQFATKLSPIEIGMREDD